MTRIVHREDLYRASQHSSNAKSNFARFRCVCFRCSVANVDVIATDYRSRPMDHSGALKVPPSLVHRDDQPLTIEHSDVCWERIEDRGLLNDLAVTQPVMSSAQDRSALVVVWNRIGRHFYSA